MPCREDICVILARLTCVHRSRSFVICIRRKGKTVCAFNLQADATRSVIQRLAPPRSSFRDAKRGAKLQISAASQCSVTYRKRVRWRRLARPWDTYRGPSYMRIAASACRRMTSLANCNLAARCDAMGWDGMRRNSNSVKVCAEIASTTQRESNLPDCF